MPARPCLLRLLAVAVLLAFPLAGCGPSDAADSTDHERALPPSLQPPPSAPAEVRAAFREGGHGISAGSPGAPVHIDLFTSFACQSCRIVGLDFLAHIEESLLLPGHVRVTVFDLPLVEAFPNAVAAHQAARCAHDQGHFWPYHNRLLRDQEDWTSDDGPSRRFRAYAEATEGLDADRLAGCLEAERFRADIERNVELADRLGVEQVPAIYVNGQRVRGGEQSVLQAVQRELDGGGDGG